MPFSSAEDGILQHYYSQSGLLHVTVSEVSISKIKSTTPTVMAVFDEIAVQHLSSMKPKHRIRI